MVYAGKEMPDITLEDPAISRVVFVSVVHEKAPQTVKAKVQAFSFL